MPLDGLTLIETRCRPAIHGGRMAPRVGLVGAALLGHAVLLALVARLAVHPLPHATDVGGFPLFLEQIEPLGAAAIPEGVPLFDRLSPPRPVLVQPARPAAARAIPREAGPAHARTLPAVPAHTVSAPDHPAAASTALEADSSALLPGLETRIDDAVRRAAILPDAARRQRREGRAQIRFTYSDGGVQNAQIVASSQSRLLDNAALLAVRDANYPHPPLPLRGRQLTLLVWIDFRLAPDQG